MPRLGSIEVLYLQKQQAMFVYMTLSGIYNGEDNNDVQPQQMCTNHLKILSG